MIENNQFTTKTLRPVDIENELKKSVFGQDEYIKKLSLIASRHMTNIDLVRNGLEPVNNNALVIGPSGSGKTFAIKKLAEYINVPFIEIDGSTLQSNNYVGQLHVRTMFNNARDSIGVDKIEKAIVFIDEFDKTLDVYAKKMTGAHMVQRDLLKLFENNHMFVASTSVKDGDDYTIDTSCITFICAGSFDEAYIAFTGHNRVITKNKMGFGINNSQDSKDIKTELDAQDLIDLGNLPELIGRFTSIININSLSSDDIFNIYKYGKDSSINKYKSYLKLSGVDLDIGDSYYRYISDNIKADGTGFRGAEKLVTKTFDEIIYTVKNDSSIKKVSINYDNDNDKLILDYTNDKDIKNISLIDSNKIFGTKSTSNLSKSNSNKIHVLV